MLDGLRQFIADVVSPHANGNRAFDDNGYQLAATALLTHVISIDGEPSEIEKRKLHSLIESRFTSVIMREVDEAGRLRIVEMMWELVYADGEVSEFEDNVVWRAADLLGVSSRDRLERKHRVAAGRQKVAARG